MSGSAAYFSGDLNRDGVIDERDFGLFKAYFEGYNGSGSFAALLAPPEPSTLSLMFGAFALVTASGRPTQLGARRA